MASDGGSPPISPGILEASKELEDIIQEIAEDPSLINSEDARLELLRRYDLARRDAGTATLSRCMRVLKDQSRSGSSKVAMMKVLDYLMDVKSGILADAITDERRLEFFRNNAKKTKEKERRKRRPKDVEMLQAILELFDKWGKHYEMAGAAPETGGGKLARTWRELMKEQVHFPHSYEYLTIPPAPADAGAFSMSSLNSFSAPPATPAPAAPVAAGGSDLDEAALGRLADEMQKAMEQHGKESPEFAEAQAHFESTLEQWQRGVEMAADGDPERFAQLFDVVSRYAERQQNILAGKATPIPTTQVLPASPSTGSRVSWEEESQDKHKKHRRRKSRDAATPSFGEWQTDGEVVNEQQGSFGGSFALQSFPSFGPDGGGFVDTFSTFGAGGDSQPQDLTTGTFGEDATTIPGGGFGRQGSESTSMSNMGRRASFGTASEAWMPEPPVREMSPEESAEGEGLPNAPNAGDHMAELCRKLALEVQQLKSQAENNSDAEQKLQVAERRIEELEAQETQSKHDAALSSLREANMQLQAELDRRNLDLAAARQRALEAERLLAEKDEVFSDTCQRLLDAQRRIAQLEDQVNKETEVQQSLESRLQGAKAQQTVTELELKQVKHALGSVAGIGIETRRSNVPYSFPGGEGVLLRPTVNQADELASSMPEKTFRRETEELPSLPSVRRSNLETWQQTPRMWMPPGALLRRPASYEIALVTAAYFRELLGKKQGVLYEDHQVVLSLNFLPPRDESARRKLYFEVLISNRGGHPVHDVRLHPAETHGRRGRLQLEPQGTSTLWPTTALRFQGSLEVYGVDDIGPQVDFSYLQPDNQSLRARLRIPFTSRFLGESKAPNRWDSVEFLHTEVACVCEIRTSLASAAPFYVWQALEMGGALKCLRGMAGFRAALLAGCFQAPGESVDLLLHAELGLPESGEGQNLCRLAVRSTSPLVNRAVAQAAIDVLCDPRAQSGS